MNLFFFKIRKKLLRRIFSFLPTGKLRICCLRKMGVQVGNNVGLSSDLYLSDRSSDRDLLFIEDRVEIASGCRIITTSGPKYSLLKTAYPILTGKVIIKHDVWVGTSVTILQGITIGEFSIIGAGCVIDKDIPPYSMVTGNPVEIKSLPTSFVKRIKTTS